MANLASGLQWAETAVPFNKHPQNSDTANIMRNAVLPQALRSKELKQSKEGKI